MATYFPSSNNQRDVAPMLYMSQPLSSSHTEPSVLPGNMMMYMNYSSSAASYSDTLVGNSQQIDVMAMGVSDSNSSQQGIMANLGGSRTGEHDFSTWRDGRSEMLLMHPMDGAMDTLQSRQNSQGLSLSLSTHIPSGIQMSSMQYRSNNPGFSSFLSPNPSRRGLWEESSSPDSMKADISSFGMPTTRTIPNFKYLKAAQQLLDEVVNVRKALKRHDSKKELVKDSKEVDGGSKDDSSVPPANGESSNPRESLSDSPSELSAAEKQDLQNKMTELLSMLDEVDRRYKQYYHQMQTIVSSFDAIAGFGAAKPYTALALQTISRHFRCLRDAIDGQIRVTRRSLREQDGSTSSKEVGISRLRYVDQQIRQQRALQQFGMMQQHAWRPQRGLPESSVSILRAWLFEHFLHP
ncbi:unnamed protein product [Ilex paraguariensis]|uniref:POX domain-containing protein n=1 Tax=Ilex paraguariensis TaxID=185542 RepID=A0ABC8UWK7_9AQUA